MKNEWLDKRWKDGWTEQVEGAVAMYDLAHGRLIIDLSSAGRLSADLWDWLKMELGFMYWPGHTWLVGRWSPTMEDAVESYMNLGVEIIEMEDEDRSSKYSVYAEHAAQRGEAAWKASNAAVEGIPMGQPIMVGHHSEKGHRAALARSHNAMERSVAEQRKAAYWSARQAGSERWAQMKQDPAVVKRRIERLEADLRRNQRAAENCSHQGMPKTARLHERYVEFYEQRIEYERARYIALGGAKLDAAIEANRQRWQPGTIVRSGRGEHYQVVRMNKKSVRLTPFPFNRLQFGDRKRSLEEVVDSYAFVAGPDATEIETEAGPVELVYRTRPLTDNDWVFVAGGWCKVARTPKKNAKRVTVYRLARFGDFREEKAFSIYAVTGVATDEEYQAATAK